MKEEEDQRGETLRQIIIVNESPTTRAGKWTDGFANINTEAIGKRCHVRKALVQFFLQLVGVVVGMCDHGRVDGRCRELWEAAHRGCRACRSVVQADVQAGKDVVRGDQPIDGVAQRHHHRR